MKTSRKWTGLCCLLLLATPALAANPSYKGVELYEIISNSGPYFVKNDISNGQVVGWTVDSSPTSLYWTNPNNGSVTLQPTNLDGFFDTYAEAIGGEQQVGRGNHIDGTHALLWSGSASSAVDLHPTNLNGFTYSAAYGTNGTQQVGQGYLSSAADYHALLWNGSADSAVDLHPTSLPGISYSNALGTDGIHQVGNGFGIAQPSHALLWSGTAESAVDLHPTNLPGIVNSVAVSVNGGQQVGNGSELFNHALLWHGTADSAVDLHPTQFSEFTDSAAKDTNGVQQVGIASYFSSPIDYSYHAMLWYGTAASAVDLHVLLPAGFDWSEAYSINQQGTIYGIAYDVAQIPHAVMWVPVPEPNSAMLAILCATIPLSYRGKHAKARPPQQTGIIRPPSKTDRVTTPSESGVPTG